MQLNASKLFENANDNELCSISWKVLEKHKKESDHIHCIAQKKMTNFARIKRNKYV